jgi:hypothetical protein
MIMTNVVHNSGTVSRDFSTERSVYQLMTRIASSNGPHGRKIETDSQKIYTTSPAIRNGSTQRTLRTVSFPFTLKQQTAETPYIFYSH